MMIASVVIALLVTTATAQLGAVPVCIVDSIYMNNRASLPLLQRTDLTHKKCTSFCLVKGFSYAALLGPYYCSCIKDFTTSAKSTECKLLCSGDKSQICGGQGSITVVDARPEPVVDVTTTTLASIPTTTKTSSAVTEITTTPTTQPTTKSQPCYNWTMFENRYYFGGIVNTERVSLQECEGMCEKMLDCIAFGHNGLQCIHYHDINASIERTMYFAKDWNLYRQIEATCPITTVVDVTTTTLASIPTSTKTSSAVTEITTTTTTQPTTTATLASIPTSTKTSTAVTEITTTPTTQPTTSEVQCLAIDVQKRVNCGWGAITSDTCNKESCCWDGVTKVDSRGYDAVMCYFTEDICLTTVAANEKIDCGSNRYPFISWDMCRGWGCCYDDETEDPTAVCTRKVSKACVGVTAENRVAKEADTISLNLCLAKGWCYDASVKPYCFAIVA